MRPASHAACASVGVTIAASADACTRSSQLTAIDTEALESPEAAIDIATARRVAKVLGSRERDAWNIMASSPAHERAAPMNARTQGKQHAQVAVLQAPGSHLLVD